MKNKILKKLFKVDLESLNNEIHSLKNEINLLSMDRDSLENQLKMTTDISNAKDTVIEAFRIIADEEKLQSFHPNFDITFDEVSKKWAVITDYCQIGGCELGSIPFKNELEAKHKAIELTLKNKKPESNSACSSCYSEYLEMSI